MDKRYNEARLSGEEFKAMRLRLGLTRPQLMRAMCTTEITIYRWETRISGLPKRAADKIEAMISEKFED